MVNVLILAAAAGGLAILLIVRLWAVLRPHHVIPRESLGLLIVAGSGEYPGGGQRACARHYKPQSAPRLSSAFLAPLGALHAEICSFFAFPELVTPARKNAGLLVS